MVNAKQFQYPTEHWNELSDMQFQRLTHSHLHVSCKTILTAEETAVLISPGLVISTRTHTHTIGIAVGDLVTSARAFNK